MEVPQGMKMTPYLKEALIDDNHLTVKGQEFLENVEQMDHLIEILMTMGHLVIEDILQDMDCQEVDHQEEDSLVPLAHLEILDPLDKEDHQASEDLKEYLDLKEKEDILVPQDPQDHREEQFNLPIYKGTNLLHKWY